MRFYLTLNPYSFQPTDPSVNKIKKINHYDNNDTMYAFKYFIFYRIFEFYKKL